jgi:hypothetical protein
VEGAADKAKRRIRASLRIVITSVITKNGNLVATWPA